MTFDPRPPERGIQQDQVGGSEDQVSGSEDRLSTRKARRHRNILAGLIGLVGLTALVALAGVLAGVDTVHSSGPSAAAIRHAPVIRAQATRASHLLVTVSATGARNSASFIVPSRTATAHYSFTCSAGTGTSTFDARLVNATGSDSRTIANTTGTTESQWITLHPRHAGGSYHVAAYSRCPYRVQVYSG